jgi:hypothetical protein
VYVISLRSILIYASSIYISVNVNTSAAEERVLLTGLHEVADIYCECCKTLLGWKYVNIYLCFGTKILPLFLFL